MGQGNAIAHLMPPPFYAYRYVVAKARAPEESIQDQINKIIDASATKRYKVEVMPGIYDESVTMKENVDVVAPYGMAVIKPSSGTAAVTFPAAAPNCMLQGLIVDCSTQGATATGIVIGAVTNVIIEDCWITGGGDGDTGISDASTQPAAVIIRKCRIDGAATGYKKTKGGSTWFADNRVTAASGGIDIDIDDGTLNLMDNELMCTGAGANVDVGVTGEAVTTVNSFGNTLGGDGWQIANDADAKVYSHNDKFTKVTHDGAGFMVCIAEVQTYYVYNGMKIADAISAINTLVASEDKRYLIHVFTGEYSEAFTMPQWVDLEGESNQSVVIYQPSATVITAKNNSRVKNVRVELTGATATAAISCGEGIYGYFEEVVVKVTHTGGAASSCIASSSTGGFEVHDCYFEINHANDYPIYVGGSGNHYVYDSELVNTAATGYGVYVAEPNKLNSFNNKLRSDKGFYLEDNAGTRVLSYGDDFTTVAWSTTPGHGLFADLTGARLYICASGIEIGDWVYVSDNDTVALADADALATMPSIGVVVYKPDTTVCYVKNYGYYYDGMQNDGHGSAFVNGEEYWISAEAGEITTTMHPVWPQRAGVAVSTQRFKILIGDNLGLVHCNEYDCDSGVEEDEWVFISASATCDEALADAAATMPAIGVVVLKIAADRALVKLRGKYAFTDAGTWVASDDVYISDLTLGAITRTMPVGGIIQKVAEVYSVVGEVVTLELAD